MESQLIVRKKSPKQNDRLALCVPEIEPLKVAYEKQTIEVLKDIDSVLISMRSVGKIHGNLIQGIIENLEGTHSVLRKRPDPAIHKLGKVLPAAGNEIKRLANCIKWFNYYLKDIERIADPEGIIPAKWNVLRNWGERAIQSSKQLTEILNKANSCSEK